MGLPHNKRILPEIRLKRKRLDLFGFFPYQQKLLLGFISE